MSIFRESFHPNISSSLSHRQNAMTNRTTNNLQYLNSRNAWITMVSSVNTYKSTAPNPPTIADLNNLANYDNELAQKYVLQGGTLDVNGGFNYSNNYLTNLLYDGTLKEGIGADGKYAYSTKSPLGTTNRLGIRPMPGITSLEIKSKTAYGSLREAVVNFQCWDIHQLEDLELLYMRPGYTVLIEWGWTPYLDKDGDYQSVFYDYYWPVFLEDYARVTHRSFLLNRLYKVSVDSGGNYDAMYGYIKNFQWSARDDGGYDCQTTVISTGEIIESLKVNYIKPNLADYNLYVKGGVGNGLLDQYYVKQGSTPSDIFAQEYEKNILAGIWTELYWKNSNLLAWTDPNTGIFYPTVGKGDVEINLSNTPPGAGGVIDFLPGIKNLGDKNTSIDPTSNNSSFHLLANVLYTLNEHVIGKDQNNDSLISLSAETNYYTGYHNPTAITGSPLLCVAHPLQISIDPTVCLIGNYFWEDLLAQTVVAVAPAKATLEKEADDIVKSLIDAAEDTGGFTGVKINDFLKAMKRIINPDLYTVVNDIFINGYYLGGTKASISAGRNGTWQWSNGLEGLLQEQFIKNIDDLNIDPTDNTIGIYDGKTDMNGDIINNQFISPTTDVISAYTLWRIGEILKPFAKLTINLTYQSAPSTLETILKGNTPEYYFKNLTSLFLYLSTSKNGGSGGIGMKNYLDIYADINSVTITNVASFSNSSTVILNANDAYETIRNINKWLSENSYFYNNDKYSEIGVIGNIVINSDFLYKQSLSNHLESQDSKEKDEINLYNYLKSIISAVNTALGNVANLEIHVDPVDNIGRIIDVNYTEPGKANKDDLFELQVHNTKSVVRSYTLQSKMFPSQGAIIAIGSQEKGGQAGIQNNTMIDFNTQLIDRIIPKKAEEDTINSSGKTDPAVLKALAGIIQLYAMIKQPSKGASAYNEAVNRCKNALRDLIVYFQTLTDSDGSNRNIIPTKFSFTMDGIGGLTIGQLFKINNDVLPRGYKRKNGIGATLAQTVTGISHKIGNGDWSTTVDAMNIILDKKLGSMRDIKEDDLRKMIKDVVDLAIARANAIVSPPPPSMGGIPPNTAVTKAQQMEMHYASFFVFKNGGVDKMCSRYTYSLALNYKSAHEKKYMEGVKPAGGDANTQAYRDNLKALGWVEHNKGVLTKQQLKDLINNINSMGWIVNYVSTVDVGLHNGNKNYYQYGHTQIYTDGVMEFGGHTNKNIPYKGSNGTKWASSWADNYGTNFVYDSVPSDSWQTYLFTPPF